VGQTRSSSPPTRAATCFPMNSGRQGSSQRLYRVQIVMLSSRPSTLPRQKSQVEQPHTAPPPPGGGEQTQPQTERTGLAPASADKRPLFAVLAFRPGQAALKLRNSACRVTTHAKLRSNRAPGSSAVINAEPWRK
jgi:hypothetical protein